MEERKKHRGILKPTPPRVRIGPLKPPGSAGIYELEHDKDLNVEQLPPRMQSCIALEKEDKGMRYSRMRLSHKIVLITFFTSI
ncbi:MAG TPA: hypothetical protein VGJ93_07215, partial [Desulfuromonadaceae bacterium]